LNENIASTYLVICDLTDGGKRLLAEKLCISVILSRRCELVRSIAAMAATMEPRSDAKKMAPIITMAAA